MILVGTSGWQYRDWKGVFYPEGLPQRRWLAHFAEHFPTVEVNNSFYRLPEPGTFAKWRAETPDGFVITVKASRYITHIRRLRGGREPVSRMWSRCRRLGRKLGPVLFQLPPTLKVDPELLADFIRVLPGSMRAAFEFRHPSWDDDEIRRILDREGCALVLADRPGWRVPDVVTGGWGYVRFHQGRRNAPGYTRSKLRRFADRLAAWPAKETFVFFNNDQGGAAIRDARTLTGLLEVRGASVRGPDGA